MSSYDQWKTASPYDDEPDIEVECHRMALKLKQYVAWHTELSDITTSERHLLEQAADTLTEAARYIGEYT